jgi:hypothetical protein
MLIVFPVLHSSFFILHSSFFISLCPIPYSPEACMSRITRAIFTALGVVFLVLIALHVFAAPMMAQLAHYIHGL